MRTPTSVLLTGATGSLGGHLCGELLTTTNTSVHCLVRATDTSAARHRVAARLKQLDTPASPADPRLSAAVANLEHPTLGLSARDYDALAESIDTIVHCAAHVDLAADYATLAPANTEATRHLIALAQRREHLTGRPPAFHYISTLGAFVAARQSGLTDVDESTEVSETTSGPLGYLRSKAVAETLLWSASAAGLPVSVYRPGVVTGHSQSGLTSPSDVLTPVLWAAVALGAVPAGDPAVPAERVDVIARAVITLMRESPGSAFHMCHPEPLRLNAMFDAMRRAGHRLEPVAQKEWWQRVEEQAGHPAIHPLASMSEVGRYMVVTDEEHEPPRIWADATWKALSHHGITPDPLEGGFLDLLVSHLAVPGAGRVTARSRPPAAAASAMRVDGFLTPLRFDHDDTFPDAAGTAAACEAAGYGAFWAQEQKHDPMLAVASAISATSTIGLGTNVVVALARSPMALAHGAHDLQAQSGGRFALGIGPQFRANLVYRYSMPGDRRLERLRDYVAALKAIWAFWNDGEPLNFRGEFYTHTLNSPFFTPPANPYGSPPIFLAATGPRTAELAGEIADGLTAPPYANPDHLANVLLPAVDRGLEKSGRTRADFTVTVSPLIVTCPEEAEYARSLLAIWCATRAYRSLFEPYDLGGLADELAEMSMSDDPDKWQRMTELVDDRALGLFTVAADPGGLGRALLDAFGGNAQRVILPAPSPTFSPAVHGLGAADPHLESR